jgi:hypothetical protein
MKTWTFILSTLISFSALASDDVNGVLMVVKGNVQVTSIKLMKTSAAKVGGKIYPGDTIIAGPDSRAKIVMSDKNVLNISPDSKIVIAKYENDGKDKKNVEINLLYGKVRANVEQKYDGEKNKFNIKTPSAVAGVRGTHFSDSFDKVTKKTQVITYEGAVAVGLPGPSNSIINPVYVHPKEMTTVSEGKAPEAPKAVPTEMLNRLKSEISGENNAQNKPATEAAPIADNKKDEKKDDKKDDHANQDRQDRKPETRAPASPAGHSMIDAGDLAPPAQNPGPSAPPMAFPQPPKVITAVPYTPPSISTAGGKTKVNIQINTGP